LEVFTGNYKEILAGVKTTNHLIQEDQKTAKQTLKDYNIAVSGCVVCVTWLS